MMNVFEVITAKQLKLKTQIIFYEAQRISRFKRRFYQSNSRLLSTLHSFFLSEQFFSLKN
jgi:hypothetical protein